MYKFKTRYTTIILALALLFSIGGAFATWKYAEMPLYNEFTDLTIQLGEFDYNHHEMPKDEVTLLQRLYEILNNQYTHDLISNTSRHYLLSTLDKDWDSGINPANGSFVGSMDPTEDSQHRMDVLFGDIITPSNVSFILKSQDLNWDGYNEIALYSTSDHLDWYPDHNGLVGVYLSVFIPIVDEQYNVLGYELLCESIHGYCIEVSYIDGDTTPSFSTQHWVDELFYWHHEEPWLRPIVGEDRYTYECYHSYYYPYEGRVETWQGWIETGYGKTATERLQEAFDALS